MAGMIMTSIYITPEQKRALARRAKQRHTTVSEEIRTALDKLLEGREGFDPAAIGVHPVEANKAVTRMVKQLDQTHVLLSTLGKSLRKRKP